MNQSSAPEGTNNKGQSKSVHPLKFKPEAGDNKNHPSERRVSKENLDKIQNEIKTKNLSYG